MTLPEKRQLFRESFFSTLSKKMQKKRRLKPVEKLFPLPLTSATNCLYLEFAGLGPNASLGVSPHCGGSSAVSVYSDERSITNLPILAVPLAEGVRERNSCRYWSAVGGGSPGSPEANWTRASTSTPSLSAPSERGSIERTVARSKFQERVRPVRRRGLS